jgi:hypothetical protein
VFEDAKKGFSLQIPQQASHSSPPRLLPSSLAYPSLLSICARGISFSPELIINLKGRPGYREGWREGPICVPGLRHCTISLRPLPRLYIYIYIIRKIVYLLAAPKRKRETSSLLKSHHGSTWDMKGIK